MKQTAAAMTTHPAQKLKTTRHRHSGIEVVYLIQLQQDDDEGTQHLHILYNNLVNEQCSFLLRLAASSQHMGMHSSYVRPTEDIFNANDPRIKEVSRVDKSVSMKQT